MKKMTTAACALALGIAWGAAPALAQETTKDKVEQKAEENADKVGAKAEDKTDSVVNRIERVWDKTKAKTKEAKDKVKDKISGNARMSGDIPAAQQALQDKGFNPGPIDGVMGPRTTAAIKEFQQKENLPVTGSLDAETQARLIASAPAASPSSEAAPKRQSQ
jgi:Putative peptidoglycan binding domain